MNWHIADTFIGRVRKEQPHTEHAISAIRALDGVRLQLEAAAQHFGQDRNLTPSGQRAKLVEMVRTRLAREYAHASKPARKQPAHFRDRRAALGVPEPDNDVVSVLNRQELRSIFRGLPPDKRHAKAAQLAAHPEIAAAILEAHPVASGLDEHPPGMPTVDTFADLRQATIQRLHGPKLAELDGLEEDYAAVVGMAGVVRQELLKASGLSEKGFEELVGPLESEADRA